MRPGRAADHSPPSSAAVMEEYSYTSTHPLGHTGPVTGSLYLFKCYVLQNYSLTVPLIKADFFLKYVKAVRKGARKSEIMAILQAGVVMRYF